MRLTPSLYRLVVYPHFARHSVSVSPGPFSTPLLITYFESEADGFLYHLWVALVIFFTLRAVHFNRGGWTAPIERGIGHAGVGDGGERVSQVKSFKAHATVRMMIDMVEVA